MAKIGIFVGTVYGWWRKRQSRFRHQQGHSVTVYEDPKLADWQAYTSDVALIVTSTTGHGDFPIPFRDCFMR